MNMTLRWALLVLVGPGLVLLGILGAQLFQLLGPVLLCASVVAIVALTRSYYHSHR